MSTPLGGRPLGALPLGGGVTTRPFPMVATTAGAAGAESFDLQTLVEMFVLDSTSIPGGGIVRFYSGKNRAGGDLVWQGNTYSAFPITASGFDLTGKGTLPRPTISVANVDGTVGLLVRDLKDLIGAVVTRKRTIAKYLDAVNFPNGINVTADPTQFLPDDIYLIERKSVETKDVITFELASSMDVHGAKVPARPIQATVCAWISRYKGLECTYAGALPTCDGTMDGANGCKVHFGASADLPYGGFPGSSTIR